MHVKLTSRLLRRHLNHHRTYFYTGTKKSSENGTHTKKHTKKAFQVSKRGRRGRRQGSTRYPTLFLVYIARDWYVSVRTNRRLGYFDKKRKQNSPQAAASDRVGRDEQGEARRANTTLNGGPHLELGRLRLETCSNSDFSIDETLPI